MPQDYFALLVQPCSQAEAEAGTNNTKPVSPLRVQQQLAATGIANTGGRTYVGSDNTIQTHHDNVKNTLIVGVGVTDPLLNATVGEGSLNVVCLGQDNFAAGTAGVDRITDSVFVGIQAANNLVRGNGNVVIGQNALGTSTSSNSNTAIGDSALRDTVHTSGTNGWTNTAIGYTCGQGNTTGEWNVFVGGFCGTYGHGTGIKNVFIGPYAGAQDEGVSLLGPADFNVGIGWESQRFADGGSYNVGVGDETLRAVTGSINAAIGRQAGAALTSGTQNTFIGGLAGSSSSGFQKVDATNTVAIGYNTWTTADNEVVIGNSSITKTTIRGNVSGFGGLDFTQDYLGGTYPTDGGLWKAGTYVYLTAASDGVQVNKTDNSGPIVRFIAAPATSTDTGLLILNDGTLKQVTVGASDSGGTGYRLLRVVN